MLLLLYVRLISVKKLTLLRNANTRQRISSHANMVLPNLQLIIGFKNIEFKDLLFIKEDENVILALNGH